MCEIKNGTMTELHVFDEKWLDLGLTIGITVNCQFWFSLVRIGQKQGLIFRTGNGTDFF
jgi:hypothetical protein